MTAKTEKTEKVDKNEKKAPTAEKLPEPQTNVIDTNTSEKMKVCKPGEIYKIAVGAGETRQEIPFTLPPDVKEPAQVRISKINANWLGMDRQEFRAHICASKAGVVIIQRKGVAFRANVFTNDHVTVA